MPNKGKGYASRAKIRIEYLATGKPAKVAEKLGINLATVNYWITRDELRAKRKAIKATKDEIAEIAGEAAKSQLIEAAVQDILAQQKELAREHFGWQRDTIREAKDRIATDPESEAKLASFLSNAEAIDRLARKAFALDGNEPVTAHQRNVAILLSVQAPGREAQEREPDVVVVDV